MFDDFKNTGKLPFKPKESNVDRTSLISPAKFCIRLETDMKKQKNKNKNKNKKNFGIAMMPFSHFRLSKTD